MVIPVEECDDTETEINNYFDKGDEEVMELMMMTMVLVVHRLNKYDFSLWDNSLNSDVIAQPMQNHVCYL